MIIEFVHDHENNSHSEAILDANYERLNRQCRLVYSLLKQGCRLTVRSAMVYYGIGDLRRRCADLRENGIDVKSRLIDGRHKEYFL